MEEAYAEQCSPELASQLRHVGSMYFAQTMQVVQSESSPHEAIKFCSRCKLQPAILLHGLIHSVAEREDCAMISLEHLRMVCA